MATRTLLFVGTVTRRTPYFVDFNGPGIRTYAFDEATGALTHLADRAGIDNPTYLCPDPAAGALYASSEVPEWNEGTVSAYRVDPATGTLAYINKQPALGSVSCHLSLTPGRRHLLLANYSLQPPEEAPNRSVVAFPLDHGALLPPSGSATHTGTGPDAGRQERSHAHSIVSDSDGLIAVADLGTDEVFFYRLDDTEDFREEYRLKLPPGSGPRHLAFAPSGRFLYVINELGSTVGLLAREDRASRFALVESVSTLPDGWSGVNHCSGIQISADGRFVYAGNRGHDSIAVFRVDPDTGHLTRIQLAPTDGKTPRSFSLDPSENFVVAANQDSHSLVVLRRDRATGELHDTGIRAEIGAPACVQFARFAV